jgi:hypothetical protein
MKLINNYNGYCNIKFGYSTTHYKWLMDNFNAEQKLYINYNHSSNILNCYDDFEGILIGTYFLEYLDDEYYINKQTNYKCLFICSLID